jgi:endonuclease G, mitochondrial
VISTRNRKHAVTAIIGAVLALVALWTRREADCTLQYADATQPVITSPALARKTQLLCYDGYALMHSGVSRTSVWVAEHLTAERVNAARQLKRQNDFHAEDRLPQADRAELEDYVHSGFDRGHMAPSGDMPTEQAQHESFSLANMVPQNPNNNQNLWEAIEETTRNLARSDGEVYVVSGPLFEGSSLRRLNGRVLVPTAVFKAIYDPARRQAGAYVTPNAEGMEYQTMSLADLAQLAHVDPFPKLPADIKQTKMALPVPQSHRPHKSKNQPVEVETR